MSGFEELFEGITHYRDGTPRPPRGQRRGEAGICDECTGTLRLRDGVPWCSDPSCPNSYVEAPSVIRIPPAERLDRPTLSDGSVTGGE